MKQTIVCVVLAAAACGAVGCEPSADEGGITEWMGEAPHVAAKGFLNGEDVDFALEGEAAANSEIFHCDRDYRVPFVNGEPDLAQAKNMGFVLEGHATVNGEERLFEVDFKPRAFEGDPAGTEYQIVPSVEGKEIATDEMWLVWGYENAEGVDVFEEFAQEGRFVLGGYTGERDESGTVIPVDEGWVGGFVEARWSAEEHIAVSFTAICSENSFEEPGQ